MRDWALVPQSDNISTDATLGGETPSDDLVPSQKAVKVYVDDTFVRLDCMSEHGDIPFMGSTGIPTALAHGNAGDLLMSGGHGVDPSWISVETSLVGSSSAIPRADAVKSYVDQLLAVSDALIYYGAISCSGNPNYPAASCGHTYKVSSAGKIGGASGVNVEIGDLLICLVDSTPAGTQAEVGSSWDIIQVNIDGAVVGPAASTDGYLALWDGVTGKLLKNSAYNPASIVMGPASVTDGCFALFDGTTGKLLKMAGQNTNSYVLKNVLTEQGDIFYASAASTPAALAHGNSGDLLQSGGHGANPSWIAASTFSVAGHTHTTIANALTISDTTDASSSTTGALIVSGGVGIAKKLYIGTNLAVTGTSSFNSTVGANITKTNDTSWATCFYVYDGRVANTNGTYYTIGFNKETNAKISAGVTDSGSIYSSLFQSWRNKNASDADAGALTNMYTMTFWFGHSNGDAGLTPTTSKVYGVYLQPSCKTGTITDLYSLYIASPWSGGTITNKWAIYQADTGASNYWAGPTTHAGITTISNTTDSSSSSTGALIVSGGLGVAKKVYLGDATDSSSSTTGALIISGGMGVAKKTFYGDTTEASSVSAASMVLAGGIGVAKKMYIAGQIVSTLAVGTKPIDVTSTTMCDNLNADLLDGNHASAFVLKSTLTEQGDIFYASAASTPAALPHGNAGDILQSGGHGANPSWISVASAIASHTHYWQGIITGGLMIKDDNEVYVMAGGYDVGGTLITVSSDTAVGASSCIGDTALNNNTWYYVMINASGTIKIQMAHGKLLASSTRTISSITSNKRINFSPDLLTSVTGMIALVSGATDSSDDGFYKLSGVAAGYVEVVGTPLTNQGSSGGTVTLYYTMSTTTHYPNEDIAASGDKYSPSPADSAYGISNDTSEFNQSKNGYYSKLTGYTGYRILGCFYVNNSGAIQYIISYKSGKNKNDNWGVTSEGLEVSASDDDIFNLSTSSFDILWGNDYTLDAIGAINALRPMFLNLDVNLYLNTAGLDPGEGYLMFEDSMGNEIKRYGYDDGVHWGGESDGTDGYTGGAHFSWLMTGSVYTKCITKYNTAKLKRFDFTFQI